MSGTNWIKLIVSLVTCQAAGIVGAIFTSAGVRTWFAELSKPSFNPPGWIFAPVWTILYILMGISFFIIWKKEHSGNKTRAIIVFIFQLILNSLWSFIFFGAHNIKLAFIEITLLWISILLCIILFRAISRTAGNLLIPYLLWVSFASVLNYELLRLNS